MGVPGACSETPRLEIQQKTWTDRLHDVTLDQTWTLDARELIWLAYYIFVFFLFGLIEGRPTSPTLALWKGLVQRPAASVWGVPCDGLLWPRWGWPLWQCCAVSRSTCWGLHSNSCSSGRGTWRIVASCSSRRGRDHWLWWWCSNFKMKAYDYATYWLESCVNPWLEGDTCACVHAVSIILNI